MVFRFNAQTCLLLWQGVNVHIGALLNDTVGTLAAVRYIDGQDTIAAMIMGTGSLPCLLRGSGSIRGAAVTLAIFQTWWACMASVGVSPAATVYLGVSAKGLILTMHAHACRHECVLHGAAGPHHQVAAPLSTPHL